MDEESSFHVPVLLSETIELLRPRSGGTYLDGTLGGGGHAEAILEASSPDGRLIGLDRDPTAIDEARRRLARFGNRVEFHNVNFAEVDRTPGLERGMLDGALLDLGVSSAQIDDKARGFSYRQDAPLDMRMGPRGEPVREWLSRAELSEIQRILREYGEERHAYRIARVIVRERERAPIDTTGRLREVVESAVPARGHPLKSVARVFQALRILVNDELGALASGLDLYVTALRPGGRLVVIAYHSLEDRMVKLTFRELASDCVCPPDFPVCRCDKRSEVDVLTKRPVVPSAREIQANPRARSARLRAAEKRAA
ncbi:MAG TPA: 16S rRNA (cytosine(1402)-N(4))-methyltransferase RsmH [Gemmatimonadota bacterium]|nr:16S rRNA (cytosine(1402)-N(4))-methyltransferase RsmH [Gemmatimonadota bacterium]